MRLSALVMLMFLLTGCATEVRQSPYGRNYFEIRQHFSSVSKADADSMANSRCLMQHSNAKLVNFERGGLFNFSGRGGEYSLYTYECIPSNSLAEDNKKYISTNALSGGDATDSGRALEEARRAREEARRAREELQQERERLAQERRQAENERYMEEQRRQNQRMINESWRRP
jgi:hypothetical protein